MSREAIPEPHTLPTTELAKPPYKQSVFKRMLSRPRKPKDQSHSPISGSSTPPLPLPGHPSLNASSDISPLFTNERLVASALDDALKKPYIVGFNHTRENDESALTTGASRDLAQQLYQHLEYLGKKTSQRYCARYDWYSIGVVLLEIGLWQAAEEMHPEPNTQAARSHWLSQCVPRLGAVMGRTYRDAVKECLEWSPRDEDRFEELVVGGLKRCYA